LIKILSEVKFDILSTIASILQNNQRNKLEFSKLGGYQIMRQMFCEENADRLFKLVQRLITEGGPSLLIKNYEAFSFLLSLLDSESLAQKERSLMLLQVRE